MKCGMKVNIHEITYSLSNFNVGAVEIWEWISNFVPLFMMDVNYLSMLGLKVNHVIKIYIYNSAFLQYTPWNMPTVLCIHLCIHHYDDVMMDMMASQITSLTIVYSTVYSDAGQRKHESSASLAFVRGIHWGPVNSPHKWPVTRKMFPFDDVIMIWSTYPYSSVSLHWIWGDRMTAPASVNSCGDQCR